VYGVFKCVEGTDLLLRAFLNPKEADDYLGRIIEIDREGMYCVYELDDGVFIDD